MGQYLKAIAALVVAILAALVTALGVDSGQDFGDIGAQTWLIGLGSVLASSALVWWTENIPGTAGGIIKAFIGASAAAVSSLIVALDDHIISRVEQVTALSAFVVGLSAVYQVTNKPPSTG